MRPRWLAFVLVALWLVVGVPGAPARPLDAVLTPTNPILPKAKVGQSPDYSVTFRVTVNNVHGDYSVIGCDTTKLGRPDLPQLNDCDKLPPGLRHVAIQGDACPGSPGILCDWSLAGKPTKAGTYKFRIAASDGAGGLIVREYTLVVEPANVSEKKYDLAVRITPKTAVGKLEPNDAFSFASVLEVTNIGDKPSPASTVELSIVRTSGGIGPRLRLSCGSLSCRVPALPAKTGKQTFSFVVNAAGLNHAGSISVTAKVAVPCSTDNESSCQNNFFPASGRPPATLNLPKPDRPEGGRGGGVTTQQAAYTAQLEASKQRLKELRDDATEMKHVSVKIAIVTGLAATVVPVFAVHAAIGAWFANAFEEQSEEIDKEVEKVCDILRSRKTQAARATAGPPDFRRIAVPRHPRIPVVRPQSGVSPKVTAALNELDRRMARAAAFAEAFSLSLERMGSAAKAGSARWVRAQEQAAGRYAAAAAAELDGVLRASAALRQAVEAAGGPMLTADQLAQAKTRAGLPPKIVSLLRQLGLSSAEIERLRTAIGHAAVTAPFPAVLTDPALQAAEQGLAAALRRYAASTRR